VLDSGSVLKCRILEHQAQSCRETHAHSRASRRQVIISKSGVLWSTDRHLSSSLWSGNPHLSNWALQRLFLPNSLHSVFRSLTTVSSGHAWDYFPCGVPSPRHIYCALQPGRIYADFAGRKVSTRNFLPPPVSVQGLPIILRLSTLLASIWILYKRFSMLRGTRSTTSQV
jgi:hypothetical protein